MDIEQFMQGYKQAWEERDELQFCALFAADGEYHNTPFAVQRGHAELAAYWQRVKLQEDVRVRYEILATTPPAVSPTGMSPTRWPRRNCSASGRNRPAPTWSRASRAIRSRGWCSTGC